MISNFKGLFKTIVLGLVWLPWLHGMDSDSNGNHQEESSLFVRTQSLYPPYIDMDLSNRWFDFGGGTVIHTSRYIRLTQDIQGRHGWVAAKMPMYGEGWSIEFEYKIHGSSSSLFGDGMAFWFTKDKFKPGVDVMGGSDPWNGFVLVFDTFDNGHYGYKYPYVAGLLNDGQHSYDKFNDGKALEIGGCQADIRGKEYATRARIRYMKGKYLKVELNTNGWDEWTICFTARNISLSNPGYIALSAETGGLSDNHDLISISTNQILKDEEAHVNQGPAQKWDDKPYEVQSHGPSFMSILFILLAIGAVAFGVMKYLQNIPSRRNYKDF